MIIEKHINRNYILLRKW